MDVSFQKTDDDLAQHQNCLTITMDNDSGYASNNAESNSNSLLETSNENNQMSCEKPIFLSEDALLEKPDISQSASVVMDTSGEDNQFEEYSHLFYVSDIIESPSKSDDELMKPESEVSDLSSIITPIKSITITSDKLGSLLKYGKPSSEKQTHIVPTNCDENFLNVVNSNDDFIKPPAICDGASTSGISTNLLTNTSLPDEPSCSSSSTSNFPGPSSSSTTILKNLEPIISNNTTPEKRYSNPQDPNVSPDLFSDEETTHELDHISQITQTQLAPKTQEERYVLKNDKRLLRRVQDGLHGVLPPPSFTVVRLTVTEMLERIRSGQEYFVEKTEGVLEKSDLNNSENSVVSEVHVQETTSGKFVEASKKKSLLLTLDLEACRKLQWPQVLEERYHGLHHNRSKVSEDFEALCAKYGMRFVGEETHSTCTVFDTNNLSPSKRKSTKLRWAMKSPGRRLSHLAKRRITFSSASLQANNGGLSSHARQILVDSRKMELLSRRKSPRKTPRKSPRKTPRKSPRKRMRTPGSSTKKSKGLNLFSEEELQSAKPSTSATRVHATKRALFQSPEIDRPSVSASKCVFPSTSNTNLSPFKRRNTPKRMLFVSPKKSPYKRNLFDNKRKRCESGDDVHPAKLPRTLSIASLDSENRAPALSRLRTDVNSLSLPSHHTSELSAHHKKKLQWAVYEALKNRSVGVNHPNFKSFASTLARVTRRFLPNLSSKAPRPEGGTSERMLRIARQHVHAVIKGKTVDEIIQEVQKNRKIAKPTGYISIEQANMLNREDCHLKPKENVLQDKANVLNSMDKNKNSAAKDQAALKVKTPRFESKVDRVRKVINFDDDVQDVR